MRDVPSVLRRPKGTVKEISVIEASMIGHGTLHLLPSPFLTTANSCETCTLKSTQDPGPPCGINLPYETVDMLQHELGKLPLVSHDCVCACARLHYCSAACPC